MTQWCPSHAAQLLNTYDYAVPAALSGLSNLQRCYVALEGVGQVALPAASWLRSLRWLHFHVGGLVSSAAVLQAATALEFVEAGNDSSGRIQWSGPAAAAFFDWLAQHPPLCRIYFDTCRGSLFDSGAFAAHVMRLCHRRPALVLEGFAGYGLPGIENVRDMAEMMHAE